MVQAFESDLYYDCRGVENLKPGESVFWMVSATHTYMYSAEEMHERNLYVSLVFGNRFNYRIDCVQDKFGDVWYNMKRVERTDIQAAINEYQKTILEG